MRTPRTILCAFNLSQHPVATTLRVPQFAGRGLRDVFGGQAFPGIGDDGTLTLTLGSHDFFWLRIRSAASNPASPVHPGDARSCPSKAEMTQPTLHPALSGLLGDWLPRQRWFPVKTAEFTLSNRSAALQPGRPAAARPGLRCSCSAVTYPTADGGSRTDVVQVPLSFRQRAPAGRRRRALVGEGRGDSDAGPPLDLRRRP